jgi:hypothetical protein
MPRTSGEQPTPHHEVEPVIPAPEVNRADMLRFALLRRAFLEQINTEVGEVEGTASTIESSAGEEGLTEDEKTANKKTVGEAFKLKDEEATMIAVLAQGISPEPGENVSPQSAPSVENTSESLPKNDIIDPLRQEMLEAIREVARLEATITKGRDTPENRAQLAAAREIFEEKRLEYIGENFSRFADSQRQQIEARREYQENEKGFSAGVYRIYQKLGELNLEACGWRPTTPTKKFIAKNISLKTAVPLALLTGGLVAGAGSAVGISALVTKRILAGPLAGMGFYGSLMNRTEMKLSKPLRPEEVRKMELKEILKRMDAMAGHMLMSGKSPSENEAYKQLEAQLIAITEGGKADLMQRGEWGGRQQMKDILENADERLTAAHKRAKRSKTFKKGVGIAAGIFTGSGALAHLFGGITRWAGEGLGIIKGGAKAAVQGAIESHTSGAAHANVHNAPAPEHRVTRPSTTSGGHGRGISRAPSVARAPQAPIASLQSSGVATEHMRGGTRVAGYHTDTGGHVLAPTLAEAHTPGAEARMTPRPAPPEAHHAPRAEAPNRVAPEVSAPVALHELDFNSGRLKLLRDVAGKLTKVIVECNANINPDDVLKDDWMVSAVEHQPGMTPSVIKSMLFGQVRDLRGYEIALHEINFSGHANEEVRTMLGETIKRLTANITSKYGNILK